MELPDFSSMSHVIPPIISDTPPPLDLLVDEPDDDGFGDFGVASEFGFDASDSTAGSDEFKELTFNRDLPNEKKIDIVPESNPELRLEEISDKIISPSIETKFSEETSKILNENSFITDSDFSSNLANAGIYQSNIIDVVEDENSSEKASNVLENENVDNSISSYSDSDANVIADGSFPPEIEEMKDVVIGEKCLEDPDGIEENLVSDAFENDHADVTDELNRLSASPVFSCCDVELDERTSPEGADDNCVNENVILCDFPIPSITPPSENNIKDSLDVDINVKLSNSVPEEEGEDGFTDFADFSSQPFPQESEITISHSNDIILDKDLGEAVDDQDDFDDFDDFESAAPAPLPEPLPTFEAKQNSGENISKKLNTIFGSSSDESSLPSTDPRLTECLHSCLDDSSSVWGNLKDLEASSALTLQWNSSSASKRLLSSISVDSRNILIGQRWNPSMPRFAANIGCTPLEPMKAASDDASPAPCEFIPNVTSPVSEDVVPAAQFDWNSSGLTNPLDCLEKEEEAIVGNQTELILEEKTNAYNPVENPLSELWSKADIPVTDILLPAPTEPSLSTLENTPPIQSNTNVLNHLESEDWMQTVALTPMPTISSNLEKLELKDDDVLTSDSVSNGIIVGKESKKMSSEAYRVVDTLPDLSFLSARKLLYAANANMARFQASARP